MFYFSCQSAVPYDNIASYLHPSQAGGGAVAADHTDPVPPPGMPSGWDDQERILAGELAAFPPEDEPDWEALERLEYSGDGEGPPPVGLPGLVPGEHPGPRSVEYPAAVPGATPGPAASGGPSGPGASGGPAGPGAAGGPAAARSAVPCAAAPDAAGAASGFAIEDQAER